MYFDIVIIGAGAAGLQCAAVAGRRGKKVLLIDHAKKPGKKILISGGGRCNFTNLYIEPEKFLSNNPHFCKSALSQYTQWDFISLVEEYNIPYHEKNVGELFCDNSAKDIVAMLVSECEKSKVMFYFQTNVISINKLEESSFDINTSKGLISCSKLVMATGGLSMPKLGATSFAYKVAEQFGLSVLPTRAGLVPVTLPPTLKDQLSELSGISLAVTASTKLKSFSDMMLITHRGLSGPAILQISSFWNEKEDIKIDLFPNGDFRDKLVDEIAMKPNSELKSFLSTFYAKRFVETYLELTGANNRPLKQMNDIDIQKLVCDIHSWNVKPSGTEGYRTAEVTLGGVNTDELSSKTMEVKNHSGLYFIGEALDVSGFLGGFNFQWAWSSGYVAGIHCSRGSA